MDSCFTVMRYSNAGGLFSNHHRGNVWPPTSAALTAVSLSIVSAEPWGVHPSWWLVILWSAIVGRVVWVWGVWVGSGGGLGS